MITSHNITNYALGLATLYFEAFSTILKTELQCMMKKTALTYMSQNPKYQSYRSDTCYRNLHTRVTQPCHCSARTDPQEKEQDQNMSKFYNFLKPYQNIHHCSRHINKLAYLPLTLPLPFAVPLYKTDSKYCKPLLLIMLKPHNNSICFQRCTLSWSSWVTSFNEVLDNHTRLLSYKTVTRN